MKTEQLEKIIEKQEMYIELLGEELDDVVPFASLHGWKSSRYEEGKKLRGELASLKEQDINTKAEQKRLITDLMEKDEKSGMYDEDYLNECIEKAKPGLSKIKDVDKALDEIRGYEKEDNWAKDFLFSKYPNVSPEWFDDNELTQEMIKMMEEYHQFRMKEVTDEMIEKAAKETNDWASCVYVDGFNNGFKPALLYL